MSLPGAYHSACSLAIFTQQNVQVTSLHRWNKQGINREFLIGNRFHVTPRIVRPYILLKWNLSH